MLCPLLVDYRLCTCARLAAAAGRHAGGAGSGEGGVRVRPRVQADRVRPRVQADRC